MTRLPLRSLRGKRDSRDRQSEAIMVYSWCIVDGKLHHTWVINTGYRGTVVVYLLVLPKVINIFFLFTLLKQGNKYDGQFEAFWDL